MSALRTLRNKQGRKPGMTSRLRAAFPVARKERMLGKGLSTSQRLAMWFQKYAEDVRLAKAAAA